MKVKVLLNQNKRQFPKDKSNDEILEWVYNNSYKLIAVLDIKCQSTERCLEIAFGVTQNNNQSWIQKAEMYENELFVKECRSIDIGDAFEIQGIAYVVIKEGFLQVQRESMTKDKKIPEYIYLPNTKSGSSGYDKYQFIEKINDKYYRYQNLRNKSFQMIDLTKQDIFLSPPEYFLWVEKTNNYRKHYSNYNNEFQQIRKKYLEYFL